MPPNPPVLSQLEVHVWRFGLAATPPHDVDEYLDEKDRARAGRFAFERDRAKFLRVRYVVRKLLGLYLEINPKEVCLVANQHGKPFLPLNCGISFNLSHAGSHGIIAIGTGTEIGIDIEELRMPADLRGLTNSVFSVEELEAVNGISDDRLLLPFFTCWTRKEAYLKALGVGLNIEPRAVCVGVAPERRRVKIKGGTSNGFVEVATIVEEQCCFASLAVEGGFSDLRSFDFDDTDVVCH